MRGRLPTPTGVLKMRGSWRAKARKDEPQPEKGSPRCPSRLSPGARKVWQAIVPLLDGMGVLTKVDGFVLERYCELYCHWGQTDDLPLLLKLNDALLKIEREFGMTPSSRPRLHVAPKEEKNDKERYFRTG